MLYPPAGKEESLEVADATDMLNAQACVNSDLAEVLRLGERTDEARAALEHTLALHERKGNLVMADRTRARLKGWTTKGTR
jgi:hypothetical protein